MLTYRDRAFWSSCNFEDGDCFTPLSKMTTMDWSFSASVRHIARGHNGHQNNQLCTQPLQQANLSFPQYTDAYGVPG